MDTYQISITDYAADGITVTYRYNEVDGDNQSAGQDTVNVGEPGFWESMIPVWGTGKTAYYQWQKGNKGWAIFFGAVTAVEVVTIGIPVAKLAAKGATLAAKGAVAAGKAVANAGAALIGRKASTVALPRGGTYVLRNRVTGQVMRTGRTGNLARREAEHLRDPLLQDYRFEVAHRTDVYAEQRGLEEILHQTYQPPLNYINPIRMNHPNLNSYLRAGVRYLLGR